MLYLASGINYANEYVTYSMSTTSLTIIPHNTIEHQLTVLSFLLNRRIFQFINKSPNGDHYTLRKRHQPHMDPRTSKDSPTSHLFMFILLDVSIIFSGHHRLFVSRNRPFYLHGESHWSVDYPSMHSSLQN